MPRVHASKAPSCCLQPFNVQSVWTYGVHDVDLQLHAVSALPGDYKAMPKLMLVVRTSKFDVYPETLGAVVVVENYIGTLSSSAT